MKQSGIYQNLSYCTIILLVILSCQVGNTQTIEVSDDINSDTTWNADTVKILDDITVNTAYTLTINPGTYIEFQGHYKLEVYGRLLAIGTEDSNIIFTVNDTTLLYDLDTIAGGWDGIEFYNLSVDTSKLEYCILQYGKATDGDEAYNATEDAGGAIFCRNKGESPPVLIRNCIIQYSIASEGGGIILNQGNLILLNNIIRYNWALYSAALAVGYTDTVIVDANIITNNISDYEGILSLENINGLVTNNLIVNNEINTYSQLGPVFVNSSQTTKNFAFYNNVIANNSTKGNCGGITVDNPNAKPPYKNNIIYNNQAEDQNYQFIPDTIKFVEYNCIQGGYTGNGNIDADPLFVNPSAGAGAQYDGLAADWSLQPESPCIDAGKPDFTLDSIGVETDFAGSSRIQFNIIDIGAFEITYCTPFSEPDPDNIIINGDFGNCEITPWNVFTSDQLDKTAGYRIIEGECRVIPDGIASEPDPSDVQLLQELSEPQLQMFETDSAYELSFDAYAEINYRSCRVFFGMNEEPFTAFINEDILIGTETESFSFEFTLSEILPSMKFSFELGSDSSAVIFDNVRIIKIHGEVINDLEQSIYNTTILYPNPADNYLKIFADKGSTIELYNNLGIPVIKKITGYNNIVDIDTRNLPGGVYFVEISRGSNISVIKVIIK